MDEDRSCATCIYMDERMDPAFSEYAGLCRSNPPHVNEAGIAIWPWVRATDWCGDWDDGEDDDDDDEEIDIG